MAERTLGNAWANVMGRPVASVTTVLVVASLMAAVPHCSCPFGTCETTSGRPMTPEWQWVFLVEGEPGPRAHGAPPRGPPTDARGHRRLAFPVVDADAGEPSCSCARVPALGVPLAQGRPPSPGRARRPSPACPRGEAQRAHRGLDVRRWPRSAPQSPRPSCRRPRLPAHRRTALSRLPPAVHRAPSSWSWPRPPGGCRSRTPASPSRSPRAAMEGRASTGIIGLLALVLSSLPSSSRVSCTLERAFPARRVHDPAGLGSLEGGRPAHGRRGAGPAGPRCRPVGIGLGTVLAWVLVRSGGESTGRPDGRHRSRPAVPPRRPSPSAASRPISCSHPPRSCGSRAGCRPARRAAGGSEPSGEGRPRPRGALAGTIRRGLTERQGQKADSGTSMRSLSVASAMARSAVSLGRTFLA